MLKIRCFWQTRVASIVKLLYLGYKYLLSKNLELQFIDKMLNSIFIIALLITKEWNSYKPNYI